MYQIRSRLTAETGAAPKPVAHGFAAEVLHIMTPAKSTFRQSPVFWIHTALNAGAVVTLLLMVGDQGFDVRHTLFDVGAPLGLLALFFLIPLGWAGIWWIQKSTASGVPLPQRYLLISNLFLGAVWMLSCLMVGLYVLIYFSAGT